MMCALHVYAAAALGASAGFLVCSLLVVGGRQ
jgi:hypothetical protein